MALSNSLNPTFNGTVTAGAVSTSGEVSSATLVTTGRATAGETVITAGYTVATLPTGVVGMRAYVTDATTPSYLGALTGGGAVVCPVFFDGTSWLSA